MQLRQLMLFEISIIVIAAVFFLLLRKSDSRLITKISFTFIGILLFEYFTQALWRNVGLEPWAYLYLDVSWVIALGWTTIIIVSRALIDLYFPRETEGERFLTYLIPITIIGVVAEGVVLGLGIREYPLALTEIFSGYTLGIVPIEAFYYIPVFMALIIAFSRYWEINHASRPAKPQPRSPAKQPAKVRR